MKLETFFKKFELFADAPNAVTKMRKLILQLAVQGQLKSQGDESGFPQVRLESLGSWAQGCGFPMAEQGHVDRPILFSKVSDMNLPGNEREILKTNNTIDEAAAKRLRIKVHPPGTVIFPKIGGAIATNKRRVLVRPTAIDNNCSGLIPNKSCSTHWIFLVLSAIDFAEYQSGTSVPAVNQGALGEIKVSLPPLAEQKRIVAKVDELMALCDRLEGQQQEREEKHKALSRASLARFAEAPTPANLQFIFHPSYTIAPADLRKSILTLAVQGKLVPQDPEDEPSAKFVHRLQHERRKCFDDEMMRARRDGNRLPKPPRNGFVPYVEDENEDITKNWCATRVGDVSECLDYLRVPVNKGERLAAHGTVPYYGANGQVGWIDKYLFDEELVLVVEDETFIGRTKPFSYIIRGKSWVNNHAHILRPLGGITANFLDLVLCRYPFIPLTSGTTNRRKLTQPSLMDAQIALPPLAEQRRIVAKVEELMKLVDALETQLAASRATAANLLAALVAELTGTPNPGKVSVPTNTSTSTGIGRRGRPPKS